MIKGRGKHLRVLVVGSEGYLGSALVPQLRSRGIDCTAFDAGLFSEGNLTGALSSDWHRVAAQDLDARLIEEHDALIYLAAISNDPMKNLPSEKIYPPVLRHTVRAAELCKLTGTKFIFPSSCSVYGYAENKVTEDSPAKPQTPYSKNKVQVEEALREMTSADFRPISLRLATVYGLSPRMRFDLVVNMLCGMAVAARQVQLNSDGSAWRPHVHIDDVVSTFAEALHLEPTDEADLTVNVGNDENNMNILDLAKMIAEVSGSELVHDSETPLPDNVRDRKIVDGKDSRSYKVDFSRYQRLFPESSRHRTLATGVANLLESLRSLGLSEEIFHQIDFYRLQKLEQLVNLGTVNSRVFD